MSTNGATVNVMDQTFETPDWTDDQGSCVNRYDVATGNATYLCAYTGGYLSGYTWLQYDGAAGAQVHYLTQSYVIYWDPSGELNARWIYEDYWDSRPMTTWGSDFTVSLSLQGADDAVPSAAQMTVPLEPWELRADYSGGDCSTLGNLGCYEAHFHEVGVLGYGSWGEWPPYVP